MTEVLRRLTILAALAIDSCKRAPEPRTERRTITPAGLRLDPGSSTSVISSAQKFIIPVPPFGGRGEPLVYPAGHEQAGKPILDYEGKPTGERGFVFFNAKDKSWQAVAGDGQAVIIINEVTADQADRLDQRIKTFQPDPNMLTVSQLRQVIDFARDELRLRDMYNSDRSFVKANMTPAVAGEVARVDGKEIEAYGLKKRDDRDICHAVYIPGAFVFEGPATSSQKFEDGGVIVEQGGELRGVQPDVFLRTYRLQDGRPITSVTSDLKTWFAPVSSKKP